MSMQISFAIAALIHSKNVTPDQGSGNATLEIDGANPSHGLSGNGGEAVPADFNCNSDILSRICQKRDTAFTDSHIAGLGVDMERAK